MSKWLIEYLSVWVTDEPLLKLRASSHQITLDHITPPILSSNISRIPDYALRHLIRISLPITSEVNPFFLSSSIRSVSRQFPVVTPRPGVTETQKFVPFLVPWKKQRFGTRVVPFVWGNRGR